MPPTLKENGSLASQPEAAARSASSSASADASFKQQPVAVEVAVTVNGVRAVENGEKREPFSENTKTVLVFGSGAVIRLLASVVPGQLLFLTNEKTRKEVVCQVVKSKNYRNVSGYVELEFTEPAVGFWGMRFPGDRTIAAPPATPATSAVNSSTSSGTPVAPRPAVPRVDPAPLAASPKIPDAKPVIFAGVSKDSEPKPSVPQAVLPPPPAIVAPAAPKAPAPIVPISAKPEAPATPAMEKPIEPAFPILDPSRAADGRASIISAQTETPSLNLDLGEAKSSIATETKAAAPAAANPPKPTAAGDPETEELKLHTARLQEELSSLLFKEPEPAKPVKPAPASPVIEKKEAVEIAAKVLEIAKPPHPAATSVQTIEPAKTAPAPPKSTFGEDELQIPAWLEPLARNASAPASTEELIEREKAKRQTEFAKVEDIFAEPATQHPVAAHHEQSVSELPVPSFGSSLLLEEPKSTRGARPRKSGKGFFAGMIAAGIVLAAAAGAWYWRQQSGNLSAGMPVAQAQQSVLPVPAASSPSQSSSALPVNTPSPSNAQLQSEAPAKSANAAPVAVSPTPAIEKHPLFNPRNPGAEAATSASSEPPAAEPKKPVLGDVHLAAPKISKRKTTQDASTADALALADEQPESTGGALSAGLPVNNAQPAAPEAPLPVGGDVKQAKLLSTVPPVYPLLAKNQHVSGDVRIDALIDATGHVTTMKVVSGPTLLHQAAKDALRQWKYQPATLDGKAVPMHLTVTIQFRLQ